MRRQLFFVRSLSQFNWKREKIFRPRYLPLMKKVYFAFVIFFIRLFKIIFFLFFFAVAVSQQQQQETVSLNYVLIIKWHQYHLSETSSIIWYSRVLDWSEFQPPHWQQKQSTSSHWLLFLNDFKNSFRELFVYR